MIRYLSPKKRTGSCRMVKSSHEVPAAGAGFPAPVAAEDESGALLLSRADFMDALRRLGTRRNERRLRCADGARLMIPVHVSCAYERWAALVGPPESVHEYQTAALQMPVVVWKQQCVDGPVTCIGHLFERSSGERWVTVVRVGLC